MAMDCQHIRDIQNFNGEKKKGSLYQKIIEDNLLL